MDISALDGSILKIFRMIILFILILIITAGCSLKNKNVQNTGQTKTSEKISSGTAKNDSAKTTQNISSKTPEKTSGNVDQKSSVVSQGVNLDDLGNISNGQYYFDDGTNIYYSSFDKSNAAHIYKMDKSGNCVSIFNGFGWSLVANNDWLYFSGNEGAIIDGTYKLFRLKNNGSAIECINKNYCYGMSFYKDFIYYIMRNASNEYNIFRSSLDGTNEQLISADTNGVYIVYENMLYFTSKDGTLYKSNPDGTNKVQLLNEKIIYSIIGNGKLIYIDIAHNIKTANIDGSNMKLIKQAESIPVSTVNSYKDTIFYSQVAAAPVEGMYAYPYTVNSIKFDGTNNKKIYESISYGAYVNIVNNKVYVLDYAIDTATGKMPAIARCMEIDGRNPSDLFR